MNLTHRGSSELGQLIGRANARALITLIVLRGFHVLLMAYFSSAIQAKLYERRPDECTTHRNCFRKRVLTIHVGAPVGTDADRLSC